MTTSSGLAEWKYFFGLPNRKEMTLELERHFG